MISVLYVDDERDLCELGKLFLEQSGEIFVDISTSAAQALALPQFGTYDAVIADYQMPEMDGIEFLKAVRQRYGDLPFILFTGRGREEVVIAAINEGVDFYLQKGGDPTAQFAELAHKIRIAVERRVAKSALRDSEQRLNDIINFLPDATFAIDRSGTVIAWNRAIEEMTGVAAPDIIGKGDHEYGIPFYGERRPILIDLVFSDAEAIRKKYPVVQKKEDKFVSEIYIPRLYGGKGAYLWFIASPLYDAQGAVVGAIESIRDVTLRRAAEDARSQSEQRLNDIINFLPDATLAVDRDGRVIVWNKAIEEMTGVPASEMLGKGDHAYAVPFYGTRQKMFLDLIFAPDDPVADRYTNIVREKDTLIAETSLPRPRERDVTIMVKASPLYNTRGEIDGAIESMRDITDEKRSEAARIASEQRLNDIINFLPDATFAIDRSGTVISWNRAIEEMTGIPASDMLGKGDYEYAIPFYGTRRKILIDLIFESDDVIAGNYAHILHEKNRLVAETTLPRPRGKAVILMGTASPLFNPQGEIVGAIESIRDITVLRQAEEDAVHRRKDWETIFRAIGHPAIILDKDFRIIDANDATLRATGMDREALQQKRCYEVFHGPENQHPPEDCPFVRILGSQCPETLEADMEALGGYYHVSCTPVFDAEGNLEKVIHIAMDVTQQHRAQDELRAAYEQMTASQEELKSQFDELAASEQRVRESEAKYRELADMLPQMVFEMDPEGTITYANAYAVEVFGRTPESMEEGINALDAIHPSDHGRIRENMEKLARGIPFEDHEYTAVRPDGSTFPIVVYSAPIRRFGKLEGFRGIMVDISALKKAEMELRESEEKFRNLFNNASDAIYIHEIFPDGSPGRFIEVNEVLCNRLGYTRGELLEMSVRNIVSETHTVKMEDIRRHLEEAGHFTFAAEHRRKDNSVIPVEVNIRKMPFGKKTVVLAVARDITERLKMEAEIHAKEQQLTNLMQNLPVGVFRTSVSQPGTRIMANPILAGMFGYDSIDEFMASSLEDSYADPDARRAMIAQLDREGSIRNMEVRFRKRDGEIFWADISAIRVPGSDGSPDYLDGILTDITERKLQEKSLKIQLNLGLALQEVHGVFDTLSLCLDAALEISGMDAGGIYLVDKESGAIDLATSKNVSNDFLATISHYSPGSPNAQMLMAGKPLYGTYEKIGLVHSAVQEREGLRALAMIPVVFDGKAIAALNIASRARDDIPRTARIALETIATQIGAAIERIRSEEALALQCEKLVDSQEELQKEREQLGEITATLPGVVYQFYARPDGSMGLYYVSNRAPEVFGMTGDLDTFFERFTACVDPRDRDAFLGSISDVIKTGSPWHFEGRFLHSSGKEMWFEGNSRAVRHGDELVFSGMLSDITVRKHAETALKKSEERYRIFVETASEGVWSIDAGFRTTFTNKKMQEILGYAAGEMLGRPVWDFVPVIEAESMKQALLERRTGKPGHYERQWVKKDGTLVWCLTSATPLFSPDGEFEGSFGMFTDISERRRVDEALRESNERLQLALEGGGLGTWFWNIRSGDVIFDRHWTAILGYSPDEIEPHVRSWERLVHPDDLPGVREILSAHLEGKTPFYECEHRLLHKNGSWVWVLDKGKVIRRDTDGTPLVAAGTHLDISLRKQAEEALAEANRKLKLLTRITRHDIMNQIVALKGFVQLASMKTTDPAAGEYLEKIRKISDTIDSQIEFTRTYQELGVKVPGWFRLNDTVRRAGGSFPVKLSDTCATVRVFADPMLERVFFNLFDNAVRHGERVTELLIRCEQDGDSLVIVVEDNGTGIPDNQKEKIFARDFGKNTGLGLFLVREILAITGIIIRETGVFGKGARFEIVVPARAFRNDPGEM